MPKRQIGVQLFVALCILISTFGLAARPAQAMENYGPWRGEYFDNQDLSGTPRLVRTDAGVDFDWNLAAPDPLIPNEHFSVRWTAFVQFDSAVYRFTAVTDDGMRVWIDERLVLDRWYLQPTTQYQMDVTMAAGYHYLRVEYFDSTDRAVAKFFWDRQGAAPPASTGWQGEYYSNPWLIGNPVLTRSDAEVNFDWGYGAPGAGVPADNFSARWTRTLYFDAGAYTFYSRTDDGVRIWLDSQIILDRWFDQSAVAASAGVNIAQGNHYVRVEYYERTGVASARVWWQRDGAPAPTPTPIPPSGTTEVIVDNLSPGFSRGGPPSYWHEANIGYGGHIYWTRNSTYQVVNYGQWTPNLPGAGYYAISAFIPRNYADTRAARYRVFHNGQRDDAVIAQSLYFDQWVNLGVFYFNATGGEFVYLADNTNEDYSSRRLAYDAIRFTRQGAPAPAPTPTPVPLPGCVISPEAGFGRVWSSNATVRSRLGCPIEQEKTISAAEENFQNGFLFWRSDGKIIYALYQSGTWQSMVDTWKEGDPVSNPSLTPPWGYYQPVRGFGKVWREEPGVRDRLGWATDTERGFSAAVQSFEHGLMIWSNAKGVYVLYHNGTWQRFD
jgi:hypothetical protein